MSSGRLSFGGAGRITLILAGVIAAAGLGLRIAAFAWNTRIQGDVNLFALTAREFVQHNRLYYPMVYATPDLVRFVTRDPVGTPATQHPPLYPFLAGLIGKAAGSDDTFTTLKLLDEIAGLAILGLLLMMALSHREESAGWLAAGALAAAAPLLVDFSANGSPYTFSALALLLAILLIRSFHMERLRDYVFAGLICGLGLQFHSIIAALPGAFVVLWAVEWRRVRPAGIGLFALAIVLTLAPWAAWSELTLGQLRPPASSFVLGALHITSYGQMLQPDVFGRYLGLIRGTSRTFFSSAFREVGPCLPILALIGAVLLARKDRRALLAVLLPELTYLGVALAWPAFQFRFMVPALVPLIAAAGYGFSRLPELFPARRWIGWAAGGALLIGALGWPLPIFFNDPPAHYYGPGREVTIAGQYPDMQRLAVQLSQQPQGMVMGLSDLLDGGIETVYWSRQPFTTMQTDSEIGTIRDRAARYGVRYVWADQSTRGTVETAFPEAKVLLSEGQFLVYEIAAR